LARFVYEWKPTQHGVRLFRRPGTGPAPKPEATPPAPDLAALKKAELVELADERGVDSSGTKADIIERLESPAGEDIPDE
jgi:SAP domain-containing protein